MNFKGFIGPAYKLDAVNVEAQRCVNLFPELIESGTGKDAEVAYLKSTDGLEKILSPGNGPIRCLEVNSRGRLLIVSGNEFYLAEYDSVGDVWTASTIVSSTFGTSTGRVIAATSDPGDDSITVFVDGERAYLYTEDTSFFFISNFGEFFAEYGYPPVLGATHVAFIDGYFIFNKKFTNQFLVSDYQSLNVDPLNFASAEGDPDKIMGLIALNRQLWIFNERSTEIWANSGNVDFPFERISGGFFEKGCSARYSIAKAAGYVFWLDDKGCVQAANSVNPNRISTHAIEQAISTYADRSAATAYTYEKDGHTFYVLNFSETSWAFDISTKMWHERCYSKQGLLERHRADVVANSTVYELSFNGFDELGDHVINGNSAIQKKIFCGDYETNEIYLFKSDVYDDDGDLITRLRSAPHVWSAGKNIFHKCLTIFFQAGVGLDGDAPIEDGTPEIMMSYSNNGGYSWSSELWKSIGKVGEYTKRAVFNRLGRARDRVYMIKYTGKTKFNLTGAEIDLEQGGS